MKRIVTKLHGSLIEPRSSDVIKCIERGENLILTYSDTGEKMTLTPEQLKNERKHTQSVKSKFGERYDFELWGYKWKPDKEN